MNVNRKTYGQVSLEFLAVFGVVLIIFVFIQINVYSTRAFIEAQTAGNHAARIAGEVSNLLSSAAHSDSTVQFSLPSFLSTGFNYTVTVSNNSLVINWNEFGRHSDLVNFIEAMNVTNATDSTNFTLSAGKTYRATGENGVVTIV